MPTRFESVWKHARRLRRLRDRDLLAASFFLPQQFHCLLAQTPHATKSARAEASS